MFKSLLNKLKFILQLYTKYHIRLISMLCFIFSIFIYIIASLLLDFHNDVEFCAIILDDIPINSAVIQNSLVQYFLPLIPAIFNVSPYSLTVIVLIIIVTVILFILIYFARSFKIGLLGLKFVTVVVCYRVYKIFNCISDRTESNLNVNYESLNIKKNDFTVINNSDELIDKKFL